MGTTSWYTITHALNYLTNVDFAIIVEHVRYMIKHFEIDCDMEENGIVFTATSAFQARKVHAMIRAAKVLGVPAQLWDHKTCVEKLGVQQFTCAYYDPLGLTFNPHKLCRGLLHKAILPLSVKV
jgi:glycine/D-amino acid oxidase-like deaminating enzyme